MATPTIGTVASYLNHDAYWVDFFGDQLIVTVTKNPTVISRWIHIVLLNHRRRNSSHPLVVGVGVQWTPFRFPSRTSSLSDPPPGSFYFNPPPVNNYANPPPFDYYYTDPSMRNYYDDPPPGIYLSDPPPDTLQLCVGSQCLIIQLSHCNRIPNDLRSFLADPEAIYVGVWNHQDAGKLERSRHGLEIENLLDLRYFVHDGNGRSMRNCSFEEIVEVVMGYQGVSLDPEIIMSDWSVYNLCHEQILQATVDAFVCSELGVWLRLWEV